MCVDFQVTKGHNARHCVVAHTTISNTAPKPQTQNLAPLMKKCEAHYQSYVMILSSSSAFIGCLYVREGAEWNMRYVCIGEGRSSAILIEYCTGCTFLRGVHIGHGVP